MNNELPLDWKWRKLGEVCLTTSGGTPSRRETKYYKGHIPWVKSGELDKGLITDTEEKISEEAVKNSSAKVFPKGTLLIALYGATIGKLAFLDVDAATNQAICGIYQNENICSKFLYHYLFYKKQKLVNQGIGGAQPNISQTILKNLELPLPPVKTQGKIVSKIEELFSEIDKGIEEIKTAQQQLKVYRQAVLNRCLKEDALQTIDSVIEKLDQGWSPKCDNVSSNSSDEWAVIKTTAIQQGYFLENENKRLPSHLKPREQHELKAGDLLITRAGPRVRVGVCCLVKHTRPKLMNCDKAYRIKVNRKVVLPKYVETVLNTPKYSKEIEGMKTGINDSGVNLTQKGFLNILIPVPSLEEQQQIVQEIESRLSVCDKIEETITNSLKQAEALRQSILKKAFEGKLVATETKSQQAKVVEMFPQVVNEISTTDLHAGILAMVIDEHEKHPEHLDKLNHVKGEKISHFIEYKLGLSLGRNPVKDAAGPDDFPHLKKVEHRADKANWFKLKALPIGHTYQSKPGIRKIIERLENVLSKEQLASIKELIQTFLKFDMEHAEVIATLYAGWNNLLIDGKQPTHEEIVYESRENWSKRKLKIEREKFFKALEWMKKHGYIPEGRGIKVLKAN